MLVIPNLNMPKGCQSCPLEYDGYCNAITYADDSDDNFRLPDEYAYGRNGRNGIYPGCPIYEKKPGIRILREKRKCLTGGNANEDQKLEPKEGKESQV